MAFTRGCRTQHWSLRGRNPALSGVKWAGPEDTNRGTDMRQSEIDRALVLLYRSNNAHDYVNFVRPIDAMDKLPMVGLEEYSVMLERLREDVEAEIARRREAGQTVYSVEYYESLKEKA
ncbi:hypothetical protein [Brucella anthropi]|uniref:hypothetical protein n=1 Tax=Brucella anthropi TaxID=529 RepID=UPI0012D32082|nr:hypothetical protein [Brucella anthropi]